MLGTLLLDNINFFNFFERSAFFLKRKELEVERLEACTQYIFVIAILCQLKNEANIKILCSVSDVINSCDFVWTVYPLWKTTIFKKCAGFLYSLWLGAVTDLIVKKIDLTFVGLK